jgi:hypothetical protein
MPVKWEVSIMELTDNEKSFKVTRHLADIDVTEVRFFQTKRHALRQFNSWLG